MKPLGDDLDLSGAPTRPRQNGHKMSSPAGIVRGSNRHRRHFVTGALRLPYVSPSRPLNGSASRQMAKTMACVGRLSEVSDSVHVCWPGCRRGTSWDNNHTIRRLIGTLLIWAELRTEPVHLGKAHSVPSRPIDGPARPTDGRTDGRTDCIRPGRLPDTERPT